MDDATFLKRLRAVHGAPGVDEVAQLLARLRERFLVRMHDLSAFMREPKQRFYPGFAGLCGLAAA